MTTYQNLWFHVRTGEKLMVISGLVLLGTFWYLLISLPGLMQSVGYLFGLLLASWAFDEYFERD